ncbi:UNVERIFIED_ORG: hypothetical protein J2W66_004491 [Agrobacterium larrymoorei]|nr:hypothetical protein [Agrobacterium larrymoorei]
MQVRGSCSIKVLGFCWFRNFWISAGMHSEGRPFDSFQGVGGRKAAPVAREFYGRTLFTDEVGRYRDRAPFGKDGSVLCMLFLDRCDRVTAERHVCSDWSWRRLPKLRGQAAKAVRLRASQTSFMVVCPTVPDIRESKPRSGRSPLPLVCRASHGSGRLKNGRFGAQSVKAVFLTARQAKPACPLARPEAIVERGNRQDEGRQTTRLHHAAASAWWRSPWERSVRTSDRYRERRKRLKASVAKA